MSAAAAAARSRKTLGRVGRVGQILAWPIVRGAPGEDAAQDPLWDSYATSARGLGASALGAVLAISVASSEESWALPVGTLLLLACLVWGVVSAFGMRSIVRVSALVAESQKGRISDPGYRDVEAIRSERMVLEQELFRQNLKDEFSLSSFSWRDVDLFEDGAYRFAPRVNVLLGKNGTGKTLLFRTVVATLQRDAERSALLFPRRQDARPLLTATVQRNGQFEDVWRDVTYFSDPIGQRTVGKVPVLAIPDSRFINRSRNLISGTSSHDEGLAAGGAAHFLGQLPFENVVEDLLTHLCIEYLETPARRSNPRRAFERGLFRLIEQVIEELTEEKSFRFESITRVGTKFEMLVRTSGPENPAIPIQAASQGTLSVVAMFGLIYRFLEELRPDRDDGLRPKEVVCEGRAIVVIDEVDAHLHPLWQQKIVGMLTRRFPHVQFILSAHSPLIVAGCDRNEVSVLRKREGGGRFYVMTLEEDFLGAQAEDLYRRIFRVEQPDRLYLEYSAKTPKELAAHEAEIAELEGRETLSEAEEAQLAWLSRERRLIARAEEVREQRLRETRAEARIGMLEAEVARLRYELEARQAGGADVVP